MTAAHLEALGWTVITIWECELRGKAAAEARIEALAEDIRKAGEMKLRQERTRRISRTAAKKEREEMLQRQARLEEEIKRRFPIPLKIRTLSHDDN